MSFRATESEQLTTPKPAASSIAKQANERVPDARPQASTAESRPVCNSLHVYYPAKALTSKPRVIRDLASRNPEELMGRPESGKLLADLCIETDGHVSRVSVVESDLPDIFREVITRNFSNVVFSPGEIDGRAVRSMVRIEVRFAPPAPTPAPKIIERVPLADAPTGIRPAPTAAGN